MKQINILRSASISLKFITESKRRRITALIYEYRKAVNFYINSLWNCRGKLDKETLARLNKSDTKLSERYKSSALKRALEIVISTKKSLKEISKKKNIKQADIPIFKGFPVLDAKFIKIKIDPESKGKFDLFVTLSTLKKNKRIILPCKRTSVLNKWLEKPGAKLRSCATLFSDHIILAIDIPIQEKETGDIIGVDIGINKLMVDSNDKRYGIEFKRLRDKIISKKPGSNNSLQIRRERNQLINKSINALPWDKINTIGVEDLKGLKEGKKKNRGKSFRKAIAPWVYRYVIKRIREKAQENGVRFVSIQPQNTSRKCPKCSTVDTRNRKGENFLCTGCSYASDADFVGAQNVLIRTLRFLGSLESPEAKSFC